MTAKVAAVAMSLVRRLACVAGACVAAAAITATDANRPARAQFFEPPLSPRQIMFIVRDYGYAPIAGPRYGGNVYVVESVDRRGGRVRLVVDAYDGRLIERTFLLPPGVRLRDAERGEGDRAQPRSRRFARGTPPADAEEQRPPAFIPFPGARLEASRPSDTESDYTPARPRISPTPVPASPARPAEVRKRKKAPVIAAREPATELPVRHPLKVAPAPALNKPARARPSPAAPAKLPATAARPPAASEPAAKHKETPRDEPQPATAARPPAVTDPELDDEAPPAAAPPPAVRPSTAPAATPRPNPPEPVVAAKPAPAKTQATGSTRMVPPAMLDDAAPKRVGSPPPMPAVAPLE